MSLKIDQILHFLKEHKIDYSLTRSTSNFDFRPASFLNLIDNGIYHVSSGFKGSLEDIRQSIILAEEEIEEFNNNIIIKVKNAQLVHYLISQLFEEKRERLVHKTAIIHPEAVIGENVYIGPYTIIDKAIIENDVIIESNVRVYSNVTIKSRTKIDSNSAIGPEGVVWVWDESGNRIKQSQLGGVVIGSDCYIGTDVSIVRGSLSENTLIGKNCVIAHGTKIGHGAIVGEMVHMANNVSLAGNTKINSRTYLGSGAVVPSNVTIPANSIVGAGAVVNKNYKEEFCTFVGVPAKILYNKNYNKKGSGTPIPYKNN